MYCTLEDLLGRVAEDVLIECTDDDGAGQIDVVKVDQAIEDATSEINGYCMSRYDVPFNPVPPFMKKLAVDIAIYNLFTRRGYDEESADRSILDRYKNTVRVLENIAKGIITLGQPQPPPETGATVLSEERKFSRRKMEGF
ncbi:MAG: DUF1320 domain-containing protein [Firmicutes bacterium]|nr:DUF1320 domain-containing protein [Bacillota bacterium]